MIRESEREREKKQTGTRDGKQLWWDVLAVTLMTSVIDCYLLNGHGYAFTQWLARHR